MTDHAIWAGCASGANPFEQLARVLAPVRIADYVGRYSMHEDGWIATLRLECGEGNGLVGRYQSRRFRSDYRVSGRVDEQQPHKVEFFVNEYNWQDQQIFTGYLMRKSRRAIAGVTIWQRKPYGFFAQRGPILPLTNYGAGTDRPRPANFAGSYLVCLDGWRSVVELSFLTGRELSGRWCIAPDTELPLTAVVSDLVPWQLDIRISSSDSPSEAPTVTGFLFSRPRSAIAGWADWRESRLGCFMIRFR